MRKEQDFLLRNIAVAGCLSGRRRPESSRPRPRRHSCLRFDFSVPQYYLRYLPYALAIWLPVKIRRFLRGKARSRLLALCVCDRPDADFGSQSNRLSHRFYPHSFARAAGIPAIALRARFNGLLVRHKRFPACGSRQWRSVSSHAAGTTGAEKRTLIYGAGDAGITLLREIRNNARLAYRVCGFIDDDSGKLSLRIAGVPVLGAGDRLKPLVARHAIEIILIAIPSSTGEEMTRILEVVPRRGSRVQNSARIR